MIRSFLVCLTGLALLAPAAAEERVELVADIDPGPSGGGVSFLTVYNDALYFRANSLPHGNDVELWRYDGVSTIRVADIKPGPTGSDPSDLAVYNGRLYFAASGASGPSRLYQYDGNSVTLTPGCTASQSPEDLFVFGGNLMFRAAAFGSYGIELWKYNGAGQTVIDLWPGTGSSGPKEFVEYNGELYFNAVRQEFFRLNASATGATQVTDIANGNGSSPESPAVYNGDLYFSANEGEHGRELWRYNNGSPVMVADICPGGPYDSSNPSGLTVYRTTLYFSADDGVNGCELWCYDGVSAWMVANINPRPFEPYIDPVHHSFPMDLFVFRDTLYFSADDGEHGRELWSYDGRGARLVADINPGPYGSEVGGFAEYRGELYFRADNGALGGELTSVQAPPALFRIMAVEGDVNGDGCVNVADLLLVRNSLGREGSGLQADVCGNDSLVNAADLLFVRNRLGTGACE